MPFDTILVPLQRFKKGSHWSLAPPNPSALACLTDVEELVNTGEFSSMQCSIASHATSSVVFWRRSVMDVM